MHPRDRTSPSLDDVEAALARAFIAAEGTSLRREDRKKVVEVHALLEEIARLARGRRRTMTIVEAAAGKAYVSLLASSLVLAPRGVEHVVVAIDRDADRVRAAREAAARLGASARFEAREAAIEDAAFPEAPSLVVALHACGPASDAVIDATIAAEAKQALIVPCCTARGVRAGEATERVADAHGVPRQGGVRKRLREALVLAERVARLEAHGYATDVVDFVPPHVTPYNVLLRARRVDEPVRRRDAERALARLLSFGP